MKNYTKESLTKEEIATLVQAEHGVFTAPSYLESNAFPLIARLWRRGFVKPVNDKIELTDRGTKALEDVRNRAFNAAQSAAWKKDRIEAGTVRTVIKLSLKARAMIEELATGLPHNSISLAIERLIYEKFEKK